MKSLALGSLSLLMSMSALAPQLRADVSDDAPSKLSAPALSLNYEESSWYNSLNITIKGSTITRKKTSWELSAPSHPAAPASPGARKIETCVGEMDVESVQTLKSVMTGLSSGNFETVYGDPRARHSTTYELSWQQGTNAKSELVVYLDPADQVPADLKIFFEDIELLSNIAQQCTTTND